MMSKLIYPTLDLFLYNWREGIGEEDIQANHANFWTNLPANLRVDLPTEETAEDTEYLRLLELSEAAGNQKQFFFTANVGGYPIEASYYPIRLSDTYALLFDCYVDDKVTPQSLSCLQNLKSLADYKSGNIGKTWMISGCLSPSADAEAIAKEAYQNFTSKEWQNVKEGKFLGATLFEVWQTPQKWQNVDEENSHVLIFLYQNLQIMQKTNSFYRLWLQLFGYRNKIIWAYGQSQKYKRDLEKLLLHIREKITKIEHLAAVNNLKEIQNILFGCPNLFYKYVTHLSYLEMLEKTISINLDNYQQCLQEILNKAKEFAKQDLRMEATDISFLENFSQIAVQKYQTQISKDRASLSNGTKLLENLVNTIAGMVEIERIERDRAFTNNLTNTIAIASIGVATSSVTATIVSKKIPQSSDNISTTTALVWSIASGVIPVAIALIIVRLIRR